METPHRKLLLGQPQPGQHKHYCRNCEKSFSRRKELREHMRTHVPNGSEHIPDQGKDPTTAGEECESAGEVPNCHGIEHRRRSNAEAAAGDEDDAPSTSSPSSSQPCRNSKPNSSTPPADLLTEEEGLAHFLVTLSARDQSARIANREGSSRSAARRRGPPLQPPVPTLATTIPRGMHACKTCNKVFSSHQALGGHRASHKKVKGCFAVGDEAASPEANNAQVENINNNIEDARMGRSAENRASSIALPSAEDSSETSRRRTHECSICGRIFFSGQALGGHKRCHWLQSNTGTDSAVAADAEPMIATAIAEPAADTTVAERVGSGSNEVTEIQPHTPTIWPRFSRSDSPPDLEMPTPMNGAAEVPAMADGSAEICLRLGWDTEESDKAAAASSGNVNGKRKASTDESSDDEAESEEVKVPRLIDIIDMEEGQESSTWLQLGIGSMADQQSQADRT